MYGVVISDEVLICFCVREFFGKCDYIFWWCKGIFLIMINCYFVIDLSGWWFGGWCENVVKICYIVKRQIEVGCIQDVKVVEVKIDGGNFLFVYRWKCGYGVDCDFQVGC